MYDPSPFLLAGVQSRSGLLLWRSHSDRSGTCTPDSTSDLGLAVAEIYLLER